ncbi:PREDICTED: uncharacterized protein LOC105359079 [Ceratosolen solmsi marchali]|uniref:Uncharacterized protein LOC105359079 n=1 Tax=Ceratosolen solmsi marchali TaxID=326594 RepID=A0AAJ6YB85_9HYME|nr:PREDICTED: uncharacterized protein LOC105359079 [Ceratosolen solmsi marchali]
MAVVGRGKGRGFAEVRETSLRRPGQPILSKFNDIINLIDNIVISDAISGSGIDEISERVKEALENNTIEDVFNALYKQALEDRQFCLKLAIVCSDYKLYSIKNNQFRKIILGITQRDYEDREKLKQQNIVHFRNAIVFLGELYNSLIISGPLQFLALPLLNYLQMLLEASEEEDIEITMTQLCINGRKLWMEYQCNMEEFVMQVRSVLIHRNLSARSRGMLLCIMEIANKSYTKLPEKLHEFYSKELGVHLFSHVQRPDANSITNTKLKNNVNFCILDKDAQENKAVSSSAVNNSEGISMKSNKQGKGSDFASDKKSEHSTVNEKYSVPRAIRGTGATDSTKDKSNRRSPRGRKDKLTDEQVWSSKPNTCSRVSEHDDRFDKDYD